MTNKNRIAAIQNKLLDRVDSLDLDTMSVQEIAEVSDLVRRISEIKTEDMLDVYKAISCNMSTFSGTTPLPATLEEAKT